MKTRNLVNFLFALPCALTFTVVHAQSKPVTSVLCRSEAGVVTAKAKCKKTETRVNPGAPRFEGCYWRLGTPVLLDGKTTQVTIAETCTANDVMVNHSITHNDTNNGIVSVSAMAFTQPANAPHSLPQGISVRLNLVSTIQPPIPNGSNVNAEVNLLCCPYN